MSAKNGTSSNCDLDAQVPVAVGSSRAAERIPGSSTPQSGRTFCQLVPPSDISSVTSHSDASVSTTPRKRCRAGRSESETIQRRQSTSTSRKTSSLRPRSASTPTPAKRNNLESLVSERLTLPSIRKSLTTVFSNLNVSNTQGDGSSSPENLEPLAKKYKHATKGRDWIAFKPQHQDRIYEHVLNHPDNTLAEAENWAQLYKEDAPNAIIALIQFFADVCGYQSFDVRSVFNYQEENYLDLKNCMEEHPPKYQRETGKYLMIASSNWGKQSQQAIFDFIRNLLEVGNRSEILFDCVMLKHLLSAVTILVCSPNLSMHHTGIVVYVKMYTVFLEIQENLIKKIESYRKSTRFQQESIEEQLNITLQYDSLVAALLQKLQNMLEQHGNIDDAALDGMEVVFIEEMPKWFEINPSLLSSTKYFHSLMNFVEDQSPKVRKAALVVCHQLLKDNRMDDYMNVVMKKFLQVVLGRVYDIEYEIATAAVNIYTDILRKYTDVISVASRNRIMMLVFCENRQLASAAGAFGNEILSKFVEEDPTTFFKLLIAFGNLEKATYVPLLVEAMLPCSPKLSDWETMIDLLLQDDLEFNEKTKLVAIMSHAVQQALTGKSKINRGKSLQGSKIQNVRKTSSIFLTKLYLLLKKYLADPTSLQMLSEILLVIDYTDTYFAKYATDVVNIIKVLQSCFVKNDNKELLEAISMALAKMSEESSVFKHKVVGLVVILEEAVLNTLISSLENLNQTQELSEENLLKIEIRSLKLSVLFNHHDLTELIEHHNLVDWLNLSNLVTPQAIKNIMTCGYWNVIWGLRKIIANLLSAQPDQNLKQSINQLKSAYDEYLEVWFNFLRDTEDFLVCTEAFECISNVCLTFWQELKNPVKSNPALKELLPTVLEPDMVTLLMRFAQNLLFEEKNRSSLKSRRIYLGNILKMGCFSVILIIDLGKVYKYYNLHNDDYGDIFRSGLQRLRGSDVMLLAGVVLRSLVFLYTDTDLTKSEARDNLRALAKQFQMFVLHFVEEVNLILTVGINFAIQRTDRYQFLYYLKCFISTLQRTDRKLMLQFFTSKTSHLDTNPSFTDFINYLKDIPTNARALRGRRRTSATSVPDVEGGDIEDDTEAGSSFFAEDYIIDDDMSDGI